ncbi:MAG: NADH-ubiquinone oxidoreductase-F iron-sulfur binding region domain-containing protein [Acidimicrobiales bacterium]
MEPVTRVLDAQPVPDLDTYRRHGGGAALRVVTEGGGDAVLAVIEASGLRGRGGAGFPTATKWRSVIDHRPQDLPLTVVVNAAEGEPGSFKDRAIIRTNPYRVLEGAMVAALTVGADEVVVATKARFATEVARLREAAAEMAAARWAPGVSVEVVEGPAEYLYGEETALLEVVEGRLPFPRIAPPWRRGLDETADDTAAAAGTEMASAGTGSLPALVNNVETLANVALIVANGPDWFREVGTAESPGTIVCTITGHMQRAGVVEVAMGTPLRTVIESVGGRPRVGEVVAAMSGVSNPLLPASLLDTPLSYEAMTEVGSGLGTGGFIVFDSSVDLVAVAQGASRFLAVESCGQCTPCKQDGVAVAEALDRLRSGGTTSDLVAVQDRLGTIDVGARCFLATQHQLVVGSVLRLFADQFEGHIDGRLDPAAQYVIAEMEDLVEGVDGPEAVYDDAHVEKQPDWSYDPEDSGQAPADRLDQEAGEIDVSDGS